MNHDAYSISSRMSSGPLLKWTNLLRENFGTICGSSLSKQQIAMQCKSGFWQNQFENMSTTRPTYPCPWQFWVDKLRPSFFLWVESKKSTKLKSLLCWCIEFIDICPYQIANKWEIILLLLRNLALVKLKFGQNLMQK